MKNLFSIAAIASCFIFMTSFIVPEHEDDKESRYSAGDKIEIRDEFRGAWLTTVTGADWPHKVFDFKQQRKNLVQLIKDIHDCNFNVVILHVVSNADAIYPSEILPWSWILSGTQGVDPGYDPVEVAIGTAHDLGMEIHAWFNPLRIGSKDSVRVADHPAFVHPEYVQEYKNVLYWDPARPEIVQLQHDIVFEVMSRYDFDGAHIDDYFYPDGLKADALTWNDAALYEQYGKGLTLEEWREQNIDNIVAAMYNAVHESNKLKEDLAEAAGTKRKYAAVFGVSPAGRLVNTQRLYADPRRWVAQGTIDYLAPQIYWGHSHKIAPFLATMKSWEEVLQGKVPAVHGLAPYRYKRSDEFATLDEYALQVQELRAEDWVAGEIWFRCDNFLTDEFSHFLKSEIYPYQSLVPVLGPRDIPHQNIAAPQVWASGRKLHWQPVEGADGYALYELEAAGKDENGTKVWKANLVYKGEALKFRGKHNTNYIVRSYAPGERSVASNVVYIK